MKFSLKVLFFLFLMEISCKQSYSQNRDELIIHKDYSAEYYSQVFGYEVKEIYNPLLYDMIDQWLNTPYKYSGVGEKGIDCSRFVITVYASAYNRMLEGTSAELFTQCDPVKKNNLKEGDMVFFKIHSRRISHVGIYLGQNKFAHSSTKVGVVISDLDEPYYKKYFSSGGRLK